MVKKREYEQRMARVKNAKLRLTCTICGEKAKLPCPCGTAQYCTVACQKVDWRERGHKKACPLCRTPCARTEAEQLARLRRHAENDVPEAIGALGSAYENATMGLKKSTKKAAKLYRRAVELGNVQSMTNLGALYAQGEGVKLDRRKATQLYRMASDGGSAMAAQNLGALIADGPRDARDHANCTLQNELGPAGRSVRLSFRRFQARALRSSQTGSAQSHSISSQFMEWKSHKGIFPFVGARNQRIGANHRLFYLEGLSPTICISRLIKASRLFQEAPGTQTLKLRWKKWLQVRIPAFKVCCFLHPTCAACPLALFSLVLVAKSKLHSFTSPASGLSSARTKIIFTNQFSIDSTGKIIFVRLYSLSE
ncbi:hypothetical protein AURANDRAFT_67524 [Aureococcus anophagefferens]|uniref:MYND-type domain-containing protein n=1 Tax=Aureococcus anophagefferens TaxID=44056 RepID=F0YLF8_AURAN|nr:hypothetical protein AURANDRAFT_67524 [Aureococcus anophagefferens]EGB04090.1 hypothetical protein AURANDRAFT_67524 [Aureococcus anophagefferens]|eukprot:XP_009041215.1 hypothetical protein AURANDRAFT_67524 [Aureococcus anophagefferens]